MYEMCYINKLALPINRININFTFLIIRTIILGPYDFRNAESADGIVESSHKNRIYSLTRNVTEFIKVWMN